MAQFTITFSLEAGSLDEVGSILSGWSVSPGATLLGVMGSIHAVSMPIAFPEGGTLGDQVTGLTDIAPLVSQVPVVPTAENLPDNAEAQAQAAQA